MVEFCTPYCYVSIKGNTLVIDVSSFVSRYIACKTVVHQKKLTYLSVVTFAMLS